MQCKNLIVLATVAIVALTSSTFASPTERGTTNPGLQKRDILGSAAGAYLARSLLDDAGALSKFAGTVGGGYVGHLVTGDKKH
ncbi:hypothetical protein IWQ61_002404 [Dispira simplex]|nr:hypothetical protein IWQ61_002404 [Dispira simplex]